VSIKTEIQTKIKSLPTEMRNSDGQAPEERLSRERQQPGEQSMCRYQAVTGMRKMAVQPGWGSQGRKRK
jgi:hypothetical protein